MRVRAGAAFVSLFAMACGSPAEEGGVDAPRLSAALVQVEARGPGSQDTVAGLAGAASEASQVTAYADEALERAVASVELAADGSFQGLEIGDNAYGEVWVVASRGFARSEAVALHNDILAPELGLDAAPPNVSKEKTAAFVVSCSETVCLLTCALDGAAPASCESPVQLDELAEGAHELVLQAVDGAGNPSEELRHGWTVDSLGPVITFEAAPASPSNQGTASFAFACSKPDCSVECSLDGAGFQPCSSPHAVDVDSGEHVFAARGVVDGEAGLATEHPWTVDLEAPALSFSATPAARTQALTADFEFACDDACELSCSLDGVPAAPCTSPVHLERLNQGARRFKVIAEDPAGNEAEIEHVWVIDRTGPVVTFVAAPPQKTNRDTAAFQLGCNEDSCTFACAKETAALAPCDPAFTLSGLEPGLHRVRVQATDDLGNVGVETNHVWQVDITPPTASFTSGPRDWDPNEEASIEFMCSEVDCEFECSFDLGPGAGCSSPYLASGLAEGRHRLRVTPIDAAGNWGQMVEYAWTVDTTPPVVTLPDAPSGTIADDTFDVTLACDEECTFTCIIGGGRPASCSSPLSFTGLRSGITYTLEVTGYDRACNTSRASATWTVDTSQ